MALSFREDPFWRYLQAFDRPVRLFDQHFANPLTEDEILLPLSSIRSQMTPFVSSMLRPRRLHSRVESGVSELKKEKDKFQVMLDVQQFKAEELSVKIVDNSIVVEGKHEERPDEHGFITRHFIRRYVLPEEVKAESVICNISSDGVLQITAPRVVAQLPSNERSVPINQTGQPAIIAEADAATTVPPTTHSIQVQKEGSTSDV